MMARRMKRRCGCSGKPKDEVDHSFNVFAGPELDGAAAALVVGQRGRGG